METIYNGVLLAGCLAGGIALGAWISRAESFSKSLLAQLAIFAAIVAAPFHLANSPVALACVICTLASMIAVWVGRKTMSEPAGGTLPYGRYTDNPTPTYGAAPEPTGPTQSGLMFGKRGQKETPWSPLTRRFRKSPDLKRVTPTGKTIKMVSSNDAVKPGKRKRDHLRAVK